VRSAVARLFDFSQEAHEVRHVSLHPQLQGRKL
jgi:hypothetical protein